MGDGEDNEWILEGFLGMGNLFFPEVASNSARFIYRTIYEAQTSARRSFHGRNESAWYLKWAQLAKCSRWDRFNSGL